jgi:hypothetical protein
MILSAPVISRRFIGLPSMYGLRGWRELIGAEVLNPAWALRPRQGLSASRSYCQDLWIKIF